MNLILFGFKGCGKTHFGKLLASHLQRPFIDTDDLVLTLYEKEKGERLSQSQLYLELGPMLFRALEKQAIFSLSSIQNSIIALGGGAILDPDTATFLQKLGALIYLKASPKTLRTRMKQAIDLGKMPAIFDAPEWEASFWKLIQERTPLYEAIPSRFIDTDLLDEAGVLAALQSIYLLEDKPNGF